MKSTFPRRKEIPNRIKTEVVRPTTMYSSETSTMSEKHKLQVNTIEMQFLRKRGKKISRDRIRNKVFRKIYG